MIEGFAHVAIGVTNLEESVGFYREIIGMEVEYRAHHEGPGISQVVGVNEARLDICVLRKGEVRLELIEYLDSRRKNSNYKDQDTPGLLHLAFKVDDVDTLYNKLKTSGYRFYSPPMVTRKDGPKICYFLGPDNVTMELYEEKSTVLTPVSG